MHNLDFQHLSLTLLRVGQNIVHIFMKVSAVFKYCKPSTLNILEMVLQKVKNLYYNNMQDTNEVYFR